MSKLQRQNASNSGDTPATTAITLRAPALGRQNTDVILRAYPRGTLCRGEDPSAA